MPSKFHPVDPARYHRNTIVLGRCVDRLVWAFADLLVEQMSNEGYYEWARQKAASLQPKRPPLPEPVWAGGSMEYEEQQKRLTPITEPENS
jgi:hypothetical protein